MFGPRVLRAPKPVEQLRRELDEYFEGRRHEFDLEIDLRGMPAYNRRCSPSSPASVRITTTYGALAARPDPTLRGRSAR